MDYELTTDGLRIDQFGINTVSGGAPKALGGYAFLTKSRITNRISPSANACIYISSGLS